MGGNAYIITAESDCIFMKKQDWMNENRKTISKIELSRTLWINSLWGVSTGLDAIGEFGGGNNNTGVRTDF